MANFTTRVELHGARTEEAYKSLHKEMAKEGFRREISYDSGEAYQLPPAEYNSSGNVSADDMVAKAKTAVSRAWRGAFSVLATKADGGRAQYNLQKIR